MREVSGEGRSGERQTSGSIPECFQDLILVVDLKDYNGDIHFQLSLYMQVPHP